MSDRPYYRPDIETIRRDDLTALQAGLLRRQVQYAAGSPFYRRLWGGEPVMRTIDDVRRLPFLHKQDLMTAHLREPPLGDLPAQPREHWREVYPLPAVGESAYTAYADEDLARSAEIGARLLWACGLRPGDLVHNGFSYGLFAGGIFVHRAVRALGATVIPIGTDSVKRQVEFLFNFKPAMLVGAPTHVHYLAERIRERGLSPREIGVRIGLFGAEPGAAEEVSRARLEALFGCRAYDLYGSTEVSVMLAGECREQQGLHWAEDHVLVEVIDPRTLGPCLPGEQGVLVLTDLTRRNMPLLRYWTGDMTSLSPEPCPCGRTHARSVGGISGRTDELIMFRGAKFYPSQVGRLLGAYGGVGAAWRILLERDPATHLDMCTVLIEALAPEYGLEERLRRRLHEELGAAVEVRLVTYGALGRLPRTEWWVEDRRGNP